MTIRLIVNADDYGYFPEVSRGIREAAALGVVTATGVLANGPSFAVDAQALAEVPQLETGVHLNLTHGRPLTDGMIRAVGESFPGKWRLLCGIVSGKIPLLTVMAEWDAQIERCRAEGLCPVFLNSHEHIHMLPALRGIAAELGRTHGIRHLRHVAPDGGARSPQALLRGILLGAMTLVAPPPPAQTPRFHGLGASGRISIGYLEALLGQLKAGRSYELMCHPGHTPAHAPPQLRAYHDWEGEWRALTSPAFRMLCHRLDIRLTHYAELPGTTA